MKSQGTDVKISYDHIITPSDRPSWPTDSIHDLNDKVIAITGGAGSIGSEVAKFLAENTNATIWLLDCDESRLHTAKMILDTIAEDRIETIVFDIKDRISVNDYLLKIRPDIIIHAAALKHVPILEKQPRDGFNTNVIGLLNIIDYLKFNANCRLCFISTDKAANPQSVLGKTKLIGEYLVAGLNLHDKDHGTIRVNNVVRFGNVFLSRGSVVETFVYQLSAGLPVTISNSNMRRFFMDVSEAARLICYSLGNKIEGISILKMGEPVMIIDIAKRIANELGIDSFKTIEIGEKPGEKLSEDLFSEVEAGHINDLDYALNTDFSKYLELDSIPRHVMSDEEALIIIEDLLAHGNTCR